MTGNGISQTVPVFPEVIDNRALLVGWLVGCLLACLTSQQHARVCEGRICSDNFTCCHAETEVADQTFYLTQSQYTDTGPTSPFADPIMPGAWQGSHWIANFESHWYDSTRKKSCRKRDLNPGSSAPEADALTTRPTRRWITEECPILTVVSERVTFQEFPTRMVYIRYVSCLRYTILVGNPRFSI